MAHCPTARYSWKGANLRFLPVDLSNCFSTSASDSAWAAPALRSAFVGVVKAGGGASEGQHRPRHLIDKTLQIDCDGKLKQFVFQSSEQVRS